MKLGRYEVVRELGKGAMGIVYLAKDPLIGRLVALKTIRLGAHADDEETKEFQQRFIREAQAAGILNHPAIVTVHDIGQDESGMSFIAMEYVEGQNLKEVLSQGRALTFEQIGDIIAQVAEGLDFAHSKGIVHRDVKPANIILLEGNRAKITDFGIAKVVSGVANLTTTGQFLGTPNYMAPEQIKGAPVDGRTDIFSLGICLYECLTRRKPFGGDSLTTISYRIVHEPFPSLLEINPQIPEGFEEIVTQCLQKDPARRYQRGKEMANAIRAVIRGERPVRPEPMLADETVVTRDRDKLPTMEIPFPEAAQPALEPAVAAVASTGLRTKVSAPPQSVPTHPPAAPPARAAKPAGGSILRYPIPAVLFFAVIALAIAALAIAVALLRAKQVTVPAVDVAAESKHAHERKLRVEGNDLLHRGRVDDAYAKFEELRRLAPNSPAITLLLSKLSSARQQQEANVQQLALIKQKLDQGIALYNEKKYADSIPLLDEAFHLNPSSDDAANYLKLAQQALEKQQEAKAARQNTTKVAATTAGTRGITTTNGGRTVQTNGTPAVPAAPAQLTTIINANVSDGYILVKVGEQVVAHENLWEESGRFIRRKKPRVVNVTKELTPANTDVEIWVVIPSMSIQEHRTLKQNFQPGAAHKLLVTFDPQSKRFDYQMN